MKTNRREKLRARVARLAELIVAARPVQLHFRSEREFLALIGLPSPDQQEWRHAPARVTARRQQMRK